MFFAMQIVFADGLLFWSALFGLQWSLPAQLVVSAACLRWAGSLSWLVQMRLSSSASSQGDRSRFIGAKMLLFMMGAPVVLMLVASTHAISHRRVAIGPLGAVCFRPRHLSSSPSLGLCHHMHNESHKNSLLAARCDLGVQMRS